MKKGLTVLAVVLLLGFGAVGVGIKVASRDIPPPDESFFIIERPEVAPEDNAYTYFLQATNFLYSPSNLTAISGPWIGDSLEIDEIRDIVEQNTKCLELIRQGTDCSIYQAPYIDSHTAELPRLGPWMTMAKVLTCEAKVAQSDGRYTEAASSCISGLRFGDLTQQGAASLIHYLVGMAVINPALGQMRILAQDKRIPPDDLAELAEALDIFNSLNDGLCRILKLEYLFDASTIDEMSKQREPSKWLQRISGGDGRLRRFLQRRSARSNYVFQPNRSKKLFADYFCTHIQNVPCFYQDISWPVEEVKISKWEMLKPNAVSRMLVGLLMPSTKTIFVAKCRAQSHAEGTRLVVACNRFEREKGQWPERLQDLVPEFLEAVPVDPFDGELFRYSAEKGIVYSVGENCTDEGGSTVVLDHKKRCSQEQPSQKAEDLVYEIRPATKSDE
jgi:hypothetical protein